MRLFGNVRAKSCNEISSKVWPRETSSVASWRSRNLPRNLPGRVNRILDAVGNNDLKIKVDAIDEKIVLEGLQKVANRITLGLILAALIVGAAMLMRVETSFQILGYPGFPLIFFLIAAIAGMALVASIVFYDIKPRGKAKDK